MSLKAKGELWWISIIVLTIWIVNATLIFFLLIRIDSIVHAQLNNYGLQFSNEWANSYWSSYNLIFVFMSVPMVLSATILSIVLIKHMKLDRARFSKLRIKRQRKVGEERKPELETVTVAETVAVESIPPEPEPSIAPLEPLNEIVSELGTTENDAAVISCPNCKKIFNRSITVLDFSSGKTRLVTICPYCNCTLDEPSDQKKEDQTTNTSGSGSS